MRRALVLVAVFSVAALCLAPIVQIRQTHYLAPYDSDYDGIPDGNPPNPKTGEMWRNGAPGCNWPMVQTPLGPRCIGTDQCPVECN